MGNVFHSPNYRGPAYRGHSCEEAAGPNSNVKTILALDSLVEIHGESRVGWYNPETGEVTDTS